MNENILRDSYTQHPDDQEITSFTHGDGFSILRSYPKKFGISRRDAKMLIRLFFSNGKFEFSIVVTRKNPEGTFDILSPLKYQVRNITSNFDKPIYQFNPKTYRIINVLSRKEFGVNSFIDEVLVKRHVSGKWLASFSRGLSKLILILVFWLTGNIYDSNEVFKVRFSGRYPSDAKEYKLGGREVHFDIKRFEDPFFKRFYFHNNLLFAFSTMVIGISFYVYHKKHHVFDFNVANVSTIICAFIVLYALEFISNNLINMLNNLKDKDQETLLYKLHSLQFDNPDVI